LAGWTKPETDRDFLIKFNLPFVNSTLVISAWDKERCRELVKRCIKQFPDTEWLVQTEPYISGFYEKIGFKIYEDVVLTKPSIYQSKD